jgi:aminopeptidase-like protein
MSPSSPPGTEQEAPAAEDEQDGEAMYRLVEELFPIFRSITGDGVRQTLRTLQREIPLQIEEVPSGTPVFDWTVPREWNVRQATIETLDGRRVVDFADCNLHLLQYSAPMDRVIPLEELREHLYSLPDTPDWIPYRTAYYANTWGFCVTHRQWEQLTDPAYRVVIDSTLGEGSLSYGERQYCSPGFNLPVGAFMRSPNGTFPEYHTSADNLDLVRPEHLADFYETRCRVIDAIEGNEVYLNTNPRCEPQLGRRGSTAPSEGPIAAAFSSRCSGSSTSQMDSMTC